MIRLVRREHVHAVFPESSVNARLAQTIARATGASARYTLHGDALGPGQTYCRWTRERRREMRGFTGGRRGCGT